MLEKGKDQIDKEMSIERLVKHVRDMKIMAKSKIFDEETRYQI